jgi:predicted SnoaL-like aldol condensation-catalyzing enzyme
MSLESNKALARRWFEDVITGHKPRVIDEVYHPDYVHRGPDGHEMNIDDAKRVAEALLAASPDRVASVVSQIAEGDVVATRWESKGTLPDQGRAMRVCGVVISRIADDRIIEDWEMMTILDS